MVASPSVVVTTSVVFEVPFVVSPFTGSVVSPSVLAKPFDVVICSVVPASVVVAPLFVVSAAVLVGSSSLVTLGDVVALSVISKPFGVVRPCFVISCVEVPSSLVVVVPCVDLVVTKSGVIEEIKVDVFSVICCVTTVPLVLPSLVEISGETLVDNPSLNVTFSNPQIINKANNRCTKYLMITLIP